MSNIHSALGNAVRGRAIPLLLFLILVLITPRAFPDDKSVSPNTISVPKSPGSIEARAGFNKAKSAGQSIANAARSAAQSAAYFVQQKADSASLLILSNGGSFR